MHLMNIACEALARVLLHRSTDDEVNQGLEQITDALQHGRLYVGEWLTTEISETKQVSINVFRAKYFITTFMERILRSLCHFIRPVFIVISMYVFNRSLDHSQ